MKTNSKAQKVLSSRFGKVLGAAGALAVAGSAAFAQTAGFDITSIGSTAAGVVGQAGSAATAYVPVAIGLMLGVRWAYKIFS